MSRYELRHQYDVVRNTKEDVIRLLMNLSDCDLDFNGENGKEYLRDEAEGFESTQAYCLSVAEQKPTPKEMIETFIEMWLGEDGYYDEYDLGIIVQDGWLFVSLAYTIAD